MATSKDFTLKREHYVDDSGNSVYRITNLKATLKLIRIEMLFLNSDLKTNNPQNFVKECL